MYECYLLRNMENNDTTAVKRNECLEYLCEFYKFLGCFDIDPYVKNRNNNEILYNENDSRYHEHVDDSNIEMFSIQDKYYKFYDKTCKEITKGEVNEIKKQVINIIRRNSIRNIDEMNKKVLELFSMDRNFKNTIMTTLPS